LLLSYFADTAFWIALFRSRDQYRPNALAWQKYLLRSRSRLITTEAICWEWLNAMSGVATRSAVAKGFELICRDPQIEVIPGDAGSNAKAVRLFSARADKEWSVTDCLSFVVMDQRRIAMALTADKHFEQAGFLAVLAQTPPSA
jgi:predicted nucleic acid-binding protein